MLDNTRKITIIAEAGVNHNGSIDQALKLVDAAHNAGADIIKFQLFQADALAIPAAPKAAYQENSGSGESQLSMLRKLELGVSAFRTIALHCAQRGIGFLITPFDLPSIESLKNMGVGRVKIPSGEITNVPYLREVAKNRWDIILSTGMSTLEEIAFALNVLENAGAGRENIALLHCTTEYPAPFKDVNLRALTTLALTFPGMRVGYSDHTEGIAIPVAAAALGAVIIEKHFTLSREMEGPDHKASLEPGELAQMVRNIRQVEAAMGDGIKRPASSETANRDVVRKSIVASRSIAKGECLSEMNLTTKRPGTGLSAVFWDAIMGRPAPEPLEREQMVPVSWNDLTS